MPCTNISVSLGFLHAISSCSRALNNIYVYIHTYNIYRYSVTHIYITDVYGVSHTHVYVTYIVCVCVYIYNYICQKYLISVLLVRGIVWKKRDQRKRFFAKVGRWPSTKWGTTNPVLRGLSVPGVCRWATKESGIVLSACGASAIKLCTWSSGNKSSW